MNVDSSLPWKKRNINQFHQRSNEVDVVMIVSKLIKIRIEVHMNKMDHRDKNSVLDLILNSEVNSIQYQKKDKGLREMSYID